MFKCFETMRRIVFGAGSLEELGNEIQRLDGSRVLVVTDPGVQRAGVVDAVAAVLDRAGLDHAVFADVESDPGMAVAVASVAAARAMAPDAIVGLGGGSALDIAKITSVMLTNDGPIENYFGMELVPRPGVPLVLIPTTAGTGSEMTSICVLSDPRDNVKKGIVSEHLYARAALLDPRLTVGLPPAVTAMTGMDALVHAIESFTGRLATVFTDALNRKAIGLVADNLRLAYARGENLEARENMLYASCLAGMAFSNTQTGLAHAIALAIGGRHHLPHGLLTASVIPRVMAYNLMANPAKFVQIAEAFGEDTAGLTRMEAARRSVRAVKSLLADLGISCKLSDYGVSEEEFPLLARKAAGAGRLLRNNPRTVTEADVVHLLKDDD